MSTEVPPGARLPQGSPAKGELWLGSEILEAAGLEDDLHGHIELARRLGQHLVSLPVSREAHGDRSRGYRLFSPGDLGAASSMTELFLTAVIDGPFQALAGRYGLMEVLSGWVKERGRLLEAYGEECRRAQSLVEECLGQGPGAVVIADDLAGERGPFLGPRDVEEHVLGFHSRAAAEIRRQGAHGLFHSCGDIRMLLPGITSCGFDGLAGIQHRANGLVSLRSEYGPALSLMGGIDAELLEQDRLPPEALEDYKDLLRALFPGAGFILASSSGLYSGRFLRRISRLYETADKEWRARREAGSGPRSMRA